MFASIRTYHVNSSKDFTRIVNDGFVPIISSAPGFVAYHAIDPGDGTWTSMSIFDTKEEADNSNRMAAQFVHDNLSQFIAASPEITAGELVVRK